MVTLYLWPNAPLTSRRYLENCELIRAGVQLVRSVSGPAILAGDFNTSLTAFDDMKALLADGWVDAALFDAERRGGVPEPTCKRATRHTFCVVSPLMVFAVRSSFVDYHEDLPTHAVLVTEFDLPASNPRVLKWVLPRLLDQMALDTAKLERLSNEVGVDRWHSAVDQPLKNGQEDEAFANWSEIAEAILLSSVDGAVDVSGPAWSGRGRLTEPVVRTWAPPRFHSGRPGDFRLELPSVALEARRWQKLVRQIEALLRKLKAGSRSASPRCFQDEVQCIWQAIVGSPVRPRFTRWACGVVGFAQQFVPCVEVLEALYREASEHAHKVSRKCWGAKREAFREQVDASWATHRGSFPFRLLREQQQPPVLEMRVRTQLPLKPQRWMADGRQWIHVRNVSAVKVGDELCGSADCKVLEVQGDAIGVDTRLSRREAAGLERVQVSLDPNVWAGAFFKVGVLTGRGKQAWSKVTPGGPCCTLSLRFLNSRLVTSLLMIGRPRSVGQKLLRCAVLVAGRCRSWEGCQKRRFCRCWGFSTMWKREALGPGSFSNGWWCCFAKRTGFPNGTRSVRFRLLRWCTGFGRVCAKGNSLLSVSPLHCPRLGRGCPPVPCGAMLRILWRKKHMQGKLLPAWFWIS